MAGTNPWDLSGRMLPPGPRGLPITGNIFQFRRDILRFLVNIQRTYGDIATIYSGRTPVVLFFRPEYVHYVLVENARSFSTAGFSAGLRDILGDGLLTIDGVWHRQQRCLIQPAFHRRQVERYADVVADYTRELLESWHPGAEIDVAQAMRDLTLRIVMKVLLDIDVTAERGFTRIFTQAMQELTLRVVARALFDIDFPLPDASLRGALSRSLWELVLCLVARVLFDADLAVPAPGPDLIAGGMGGVCAAGTSRRRAYTPAGRRAAALADLGACLYQLIAQRRRSPGNDVLTLLTRAGDRAGKMTDRQIRDQMMMLFAASHETTASALTWTFYLLAAHAQVQHHVLAELRAVLGSGSPVPAHLSDLPYLGWVVAESLRMYPPAWTLGRRAVAAFDLGGYHFPAGTTVMLSQWVIHRLPDIWGDPEVFRPERWDPAKGQHVPPGAYFPFGGGPHLCVAVPFVRLAMRLILATVLQRYHLWLVPNCRPVPRPRVILWPKGQVRIWLEPASAAASMG